MICKYVSKIYKSQSYFFLEGCSSILYDTSVVIGEIEKEVWLDVLSQQFRVPWNNVGLCWICS